MRIVAFFVVVISALVIAHALINAGLKRTETSVFGEFNRIVDGRINATILVTGSSRALNHYDPREITRSTGLSAWNIGVNGSQTDMQLAVLRTYLRHNVPPALLIHNLDSFSFATSKDGVAFPDSYLPYLDEPPIYDTLRRIDSHWWKAKYLPLYGYAVEDMRFSWLLGVTSLLGWSPRESRFAGFEPRFATWNEDFDRFKQLNPNGVSFAEEPQAVRDFEQIVSEVTTRGGHVLLVYSPVYYEMQELDLQKVALFTRFQSIARRYDASLWDYSDSPISRHRELFYNSQHLNAEGAARFSVALASRLRVSGLLERQHRIAPNDARNEH